MNNIYWQIKHIHEVQGIEEAAALVNSGWVVILILKHKDGSHSFICGTDRDVDMKKMFGDKAAQ